MITVTLYRSALVAAGACQEDLAVYDRIAAAQPDSDARKGKRLKVRWTPLHRVWLSQEFPSFYEWLRDRDLIVESNLRGANLYGANLGGANLRGADLYGADLGDYERDESTGYAKRKASK